MLGFFVEADSIPPTLNVAQLWYDAQLGWIVLLLCLLAYNFAVFSKFALLTLANLEKGYFCLVRIE